MLLGEGIGKTPRKEDSDQNSGGAEPGDFEKSERTKNLGNWVKAGADQQ